MHWDKHSELEGRHSFLSPSKYHWVNYTEDKLRLSYLRHLATMNGTLLHEYAASAIKNKRRQPRNNDTVNMYINDAIGFKMKPEQPLKYSDNCFGTADAISYDEKRKLLRIHDLKTGEIPAHIEQLEIYAALFILEKGFKLGIRSPEEINIELRIYQNGEVLIENPEPSKIAEIMAKIVAFDKIIEEINNEE